MLGVPEISPKTLQSPHIRRIGWEMAKGLPVQDAIKVVREKLTKRLKDPFFVEERQRRIQKEEELAKSLEDSDRDALTGLYNRKFALGGDASNSSGELGRLLLTAQREGKPLSIILMDIDHFKYVNDRFGHPAGDSVLEAFGNLIQTFMKRKTDLAARVGGEEFLLILPNTDLVYAKKLAEEIRVAVENQNFNPNEKTDRPNKITISAGVTTFTKELSKRKERIDLYGNADKALYSAKREGRNQLMIAEEDIMEDGKLALHIHGPLIREKRFTRLQASLHRFFK